MGKFIILTFLFMGFVFYELSGGSDFVPVADEKRAALDAEREALRLAEAEQNAERNAQQLAQRQASQDDVALPQITLASAVVQDQAQPAILPAVATVQSLSSAQPAVSAEKARIVTDAAPTQPVQSDTAVTDTVVAEAEITPDLREVTSARVNMRNGPGRKFSIVGKLNGGDQVQVLQDDGSGWVKLKVVETGRIAWMADFLLTAANN